MRHTLRSHRFPALLSAAVLCAGSSLHAQISITTAVDLAIRNSPRVKSSEADVTKARAILLESKDVYIPNLNAGAGIGQAYGYSNYPPTLFTLNSSSLLYNASQFSYIRAARAGLDAAQRLLEDVREQVAEDAAITFTALDKDQQRDAVLRQESAYSARLLEIVQERFDAGTDTKMELLDTKLSAANLHVAVLRASEDTANDRAHLARLLGVSPDNLRAEGGFPSAPLTPEDSASTGGYANASVASAFANAKAKQMQAYGDTHFLYRPQISLAIQFNRYATFTNAWTLIENQYKASNGGRDIGADYEVFGVQINLPLFDRFRRQKGVESTADATRALHDAEFAQINVLDAQTRLNHSIELLQAQADVAAIEQQRAQLQLETTRLRIASAGSGPPATPKDEQNSLIFEREKYLVTVETAFSLHQAQLSLLRQTGHLEDWLLHSGLSAAPATPSTVQPHP